MAYVCCWNGGSRDQGCGWGGCGVGSSEKEEAEEGERVGPHF